MASQLGDKIFKLIGCAGWAVRIHPSLDQFDWEMALRLQIQAFVFCSALR